MGKSDYNKITKVTKLIYLFARISYLVFIFI